ncbi:glycosyltransferase [Roseovarius sp. M141]|uniref:glycosyltransferase n=1 Tax=Roseovarius sp. M141 TaxID=2583806 RepID=UPI0020CD7D66|nr:glycosyltransferase [Roseovarius sp. M141]MCQ0090552.1 glycosyltransferase [Roseovarius sp. M141]
MARFRADHFDPDWYLSVYPDVGRAGIDPRKHYLRHGRVEGRLPCLLTAMLRERDLAMGMLEGGVDALRDIARQDAHPGERAWAAIAIARQAAARGDWPQAEDALSALDPARDLIHGFGLPDPALLAIESAVMAGDPSRARALLGKAVRGFGRTPDLMLAQCNIIAATNGHTGAWHRHMALLFGGAGLAGPRVARAAGDLPAFDRLQTSRWPLPFAAIHRGPLVSVLMPARNAATTIETALRSLMAQSWHALEILVIDNGSTDDTRAMVARLGQTDPRIRLLDGAQAPGAYAARNIGLAAAGGAFITVQDADDWSHPARIAFQVRRLLRKPAAAASVSHWVRATPDLRFTRWWGDAGLVHRNTSSLMIRAALRDTLGFWDRTRAGADTEYWQRIRHVHGDTAVSEVRPGLPLAFGRQTDSSLTRHGDTNIASLRMGARRSYHLASLRWHARAADTGALPLPQHPAQRPFAIPDSIGVGDPAAQMQPEDLIRQSGLFDEGWYLQTYADLRAAPGGTGVDGAVHYLETGASEGRDPGPGFSTTGYALAHGVTDQNPLLHYLHTGRARGLDPLPVLAGDLAARDPARPVLFFGHQARREIFGAERSLLDMLDRARGAGLTPSVVLPHVMNADYLAALKLRCHRIHVRPFGWLFGGVAPHPATLAGLCALIRDSGAQDIHQNTLVMDAPLRAARQLGLRTTVHIRELPGSDPQLCLDLGLTAPALRRQILSSADRFVVNSRAVQDWLGADASRVGLVHNTADPALFDVAFAPATPPRVALIGSLSAKKGVADMVRLAHLADRAGVKAQFRLIGPCAPDPAQFGKLPPNLCYAGYADSPVDAMKGADIVLSISHFAESFGRTVLEAMAAGRPVICYDRGTPPDLVGRDGSAGHVVAADDPQAVLDALRLLLGDATALTKVSDAARRRAWQLQQGALAAAAGVYASANQG